MSLPHCSYSFCYIMFNIFLVIKKYQNHFSLQFFLSLSEILPVFLFTFILLSPFCKYHLSSMESLHKIQPLFNSFKIFIWYSLVGPRHFFYPYTEDKQLQLDQKLFVHYLLVVYRMLLANTQSIKF